ncbi:hypothetical protein ABFB09_05785 [Dehalogenimonas sp. THU2]|uniref:hypothetical protein n=1 Tax=Dehalogenimonas sp. THU2 TaxID=3151121 RepID=UPI003218A7F9
MSKLEELKPNSIIRGIIPDSLVTVISQQWFGSDAVELIYKTQKGNLGNVILYRGDESRFEVVEKERPWNDKTKPIIYQPQKNGCRALWGGSHFSQNYI